MSNSTYQQVIAHIFWWIFTHATFEAFFSFFKELIKIFLDSNDWKAFLKGELIDKNVLNKILSMLNDKTLVLSLNCDKLWCKLLQSMCDSYDNPKLLDEYDDNNDSESKQDDKYDYYCDKNDLMVEKSKSSINYNVNSNDKKSKCILCNKLCNMMDYEMECIECTECVCNNCNVDFKQLNQMLKMKQFEQFGSKISKYDKNNKILKLVGLYFDLFFFLSLCLISFESII